MYTIFGYYTTILNNVFKSELLNTQQVYFTRKRVKPFIYSIMLYFCDSYYKCFGCVLNSAFPLSNGEQIKQIGTYTDSRMKGWMVGWLNGRIDECLEKSWMEGWLVSWMNRWMAREKLDGGMFGWLVGFRNE